MDKIRIVIRNPTVEELWGWIREGGLLYYSADRMNDPYFSAFLESVVVPDEEVNEIVLEGSVKEVIGREWNPYFALVTWIRRVGAMTTQMYELIGLVEDMTVSTLTPPIDMDDVTNIVRILTMPDGWEQWVALGENVDLNHLRRMGELSLLTSGDGLLWERSRPANQFPTWIINSIYKIVEDREKDKMKILLSGILRDALLIHSTGEWPSDRKLHLFDIRWDVLLAAMNDEKMDNTSISYNSVATLAGRGRSDLLTIRLSPALSIDRESPTLAFELDREDINSLYEVALPQLPNDLDLQAMGLNSILQPGVSAISPIALNAMSQKMRSIKMKNAILLIVPIVHMRILDLLRHYCTSVQWPHKIGYEGDYRTKEVNWNVKFLNWELPREAINRIHLTILRAMLRSDDRNLRAYDKALVIAIDTPMVVTVEVNETDLVKALIDITSKK